MKHWKAIVKDDEGSVRISFTLDTADPEVARERLLHLLGIHSYIEKLDFVASHTPNCGTKYRGCAPECTFEADCKALFGDE